ncbi:hypothetical protein NMG60_11001407 [Bertholletia excelsa]
MSASAIARSSVHLRTLCRALNSSSRPSLLPNLLLHRAPKALSRSSLRLRRESIFLSSLLPAHSAIASACLVSMLPSELSSSTEGRFISYVSPI